MRASRFNLHFDRANGSTLLWNSASGVLAEVEPEHIATIERLLASPESAQGEEELAFRESLVESGFLVSGMDEIQRLRVESLRYRFGQRSLSLSIAPTLACNLACDYCYASRRPGRMSAEVEAALLEFIDRRAKGMELISLGFIGGEPLLCLDTLERIVEGSRRIAENRGARLLPSGLVTNGVLLDKAAVERLHRAGVGVIQVTLDGPREVHDARRTLAGGGGTFDRILANLTEASEVIPCRVRINVDKRNQDAALVLVEELAARGLVERLQPSFAPVDPNAFMCAAVSERCHHLEPYARWEAEAYRRLGERGIWLIEPPRPLSGSYCAADVEGSFVVGPDGTLYKCWESVGKAGFSVGTVVSDERTAEQEAKLFAYLARDPFRSKTCLDCALLPACLGGCPEKALETPDGEGDCCTFKYNLGLLLELQTRKTESEGR